MPYLSNIDDLDMTCIDFVNALKMLMCSEKHPIPRANRVVLYCIVLYCIVLYCIVLYCIVLYCIV